MAPLDALPDAMLLARARRAYEMGRISAAMLRSVWLVPVLGLSLLCCSDPTWSLASGMGLIAAVTCCLWWGQAWGRGVWPGLIAGLVPMIAPLVMQMGGHCCSMGDRCYLYPGVCILAGIAGGVALALIAPRPREGHGVPFFAASLITGLAGAVGCLVYGLIGVAGMVLGLLAGAAPILVTRRARG